MWFSTMINFSLASHKAFGVLEVYHVQLGALQIVGWLVHKLKTGLHSSYWLDRFANESDGIITHIIWNPGSELLSCNYS